MNNQYLIQEYLRQLEEEERLKAGNTYDKLKGYASSLNRYGNNISTTGNLIKDNINNEVAKKIGNSINNIGGNISNGATSFTNTLNAPSNYFKGVANRAVGTGLQNVGQTLATKTGAIGTIGNALANTGASLSAGTAAGTTAGATAGAAGGSAAGGAMAAGPIAALAVMALTGANRKRAKKSGQALMGMTNDIVKQGQDSALQDTQANTSALQEQANQALSQGIATGGAAPVVELDPLQEYQNYLRDSGYSDEVVNGVAQGLNYGNKDVADWISQYNAGVGSNNPINIPTTEEEIAAAKLGKFNAPIQVGGLNKNQNNGLLGKLTNGLSDLSKGYVENKTTAFKPENILPDEDKSKMQRIGEAAGSISRFAQKPGVQALLAGGLSTALTGNPLYGLGMAQKFGNMRANSDIFQEVLAKQGINVDPGMFGAISAKDMEAIMSPELKKIYYQSLADYRNQKLVNDKEYKDQKLIIDKQNADSKAIQAGASATRADKYNGGASRNNKPENHPDWNDDLAGFTTIFTDPRYASKANEAKIRFMAKYGVDPMKYIKL